MAEKMKLALMEFLILRSKALIHEESKELILKKY